METVPRDSFPRQPLRPSYEESSGPANVQPHLPQLEAPIRVLQSAIVQLKTEDESSDGKLQKAYQAHADHSATAQSLSARQDTVLSCGDTTVYCEDPSG